MLAGDVGRLKSTLRLYVLTSLCLNLSRQRFPPYQPPIFPYNQDHLANPWSD